MSIIGYIIGLGDRHLDNVLVNFLTGDVSILGFTLSVDQGNLKGESVLAAILPSHMEVSYCTSGFFRS